MDWVHTYALVADQSACWVCVEFPLSRLAGLPWRISPASVSNWTSLQNQWNSKHPCGMLPGLTSVLGPNSSVTSPGCEVTIPYRMARGGSQLRLWIWLDQHSFALRTPRTSPGGLDSDRSVSDSFSWTLLGGEEWCVGCSSHWAPLGGWLT